MSAAPLWTHLPVLEMSLLFLYHIVTAHALWPAPVYCWLLLVSGWARRAALLWAALPVIAIGGVEKLGFHTQHFLSIIVYRLLGMTDAVGFTPPDVFPTDPMTHVTPGQFLLSPSLWIGLLIAGAFLFAAIRLRRYQGPI
jgi:ABC-2 type transport system permease protein